MKKIYLSICLSVLAYTFSNAQKKSELIAEIATLSSQLDSVNNEVAEARRNEKASLTKAESFENQAKELRSANKTLLGNLNNFSQLSSQNSSNINKVLESLSEKETQLKTITDAFASNDSTALVVLTSAKQTLGENANIGVSDGAVIISKDLTALFASDVDSTLKAESKDWIKKIADILIANPNSALTIEGMSITGDLNIPAQQANAISNSLQKMEVTLDRITALGKDGGFKEGIRLKIHPKYEEFYTKIRESMKNSN